MESEEEEEEGRPIGKKQAKMAGATKKKVWLRAGDLWLRRQEKRIVSEKALELQEKEHQEQVKAREKQIMSRDLSKVYGTAQGYYELMQKQTLCGLEERDKEREGNKKSDKEIIHRA
jgi:hypothetical protein